MNSHTRGILHCARYLRLHCVLSKFSTSPTFPPGFPCNLLFKFCFPSTLMLGKEWSQTKAFLAPQKTGLVHSPCGDKITAQLLSLPNQSPSLLSAGVDLTHFLYTNVQFTVCIPENTMSNLYLTKHQDPSTLLMLLPLMKFCKHKVKLICHMKN